MRDSIPIPKEAILSKEYIQTIQDGINDGLKMTGKQAVIESIEWTLEGYTIHCEVLDLEQETEQDENSS